MVRYFSLKGMLLKDFHCTRIRQRFFVILKFLTLIVLVYSEKAVLDSAVEALCCIT
ncbi:MAG: hypothetical protein OFPI_24390 [Osedax symbiont Rs2]|nr:MAG: hypothetical protein OFPI_24390 [Osedax symbiont Rs2]